MPLHRNGSFLQKIVFHCSKHFYERKLHAFPRMCDGVYAGSFRGTLSFAAWIVFKEKGTIAKLDPPPGLHFWCTEKGSYGVENMLETI